MTSSEQPAYPSLLQTVGLGAFEIGGTGGGSGNATNYGQDVTSDFVTAIINGPATALGDIHPFTAVSDVITTVESFLNTMPLQGLQVFQAFLSGTTSADFVDVPTAVTTIMNALGLGNLSSTVASLGRLVNDVMILLDVFHLTYDVGTSSDPPGTLGVGGVGAGKPTWFSAWNDLIAYIEAAAGITSTAAAPTFGTVITAAKTDLQTVIDGLEQAVNGGSATGAAASTVKTNLGVLFNSLFGSTTAGSVLTTGAIPNITKAMSTDLQSVITNIFGGSSIGTVLQYPALPHITIGGVSTDVESHIQAIVDGIFQSQHGGSSTGNATATIVPALTAIPASNVVGLTAATVTYGNAGSNFGTGSSMSFSYTPDSTDTLVVAVVPWYGSSSSNGTSTCTFGGTSMTLEAQAVSATFAGSYLHFDVFSLKITAGAGAKTLAWANSLASGVDVGVMSFYAQKILNHGNTGGGISSSAALTMSYTSGAPSPTSNRVIAAFAEIGTSNATWSGFTPGTAHVNNGPTGAYGSVGLYAGEAAGSASALNFSATHGLTGGPAGQWLGFTIELSN